MSPARADLDSMAHRATRPIEDDDGFTLVELLIVIVILGVVATVTVFAVRGISEQADENACTAELVNLQKAQAVHWTLNGSYADETTLVANGVISTPSTMYEVSASTADTYAIVPAGSCTGSATETGGPAAPSPTAPVVMPTASFAWHGGVTAWRFGADGDGADEIVLLGRNQGKADWVAATDASVSSTRRVHFVDMDSLNVSSLTALLVMINSNGVAALGVYAADDTSGLPGSSAASIRDHLAGILGSYPNTMLHLMSPSSNLQSLFATAT